MKFKSTPALISSILFLLASSSSTVFADAPPAQAIGSGVFFYAWNANGHCSTDTSTNPTGKCPELWTDIIKNINAQIPASADRAKIKFIYLDSVSLNLPAPPISKTIFTVGGCDDGASADVVFCTRSAGLTYSSPQAESGYQAVSELNTVLNTASVPGYYIIPTISASGDANLESLSADQLKSLAYSLACIVNSDATPPSSFSNGFSGPTKCQDVFQYPKDLPRPPAANTASPISGLGFDIESPDLSNSKNADPQSAADFYTALQSAMGASSPSSPKFIMVSRGPNGLNENQNGTIFGTLLNTLNANANLPTFIFGPQIYDLCDGFGTWACPADLPYNSSANGSTYGSSLLFDPIPSSANDGTNWNTVISGEGGLYFTELFGPHPFYSSLNKNLGTTYPNIPVQPVISAGGSSQIWDHSNLYNIDFSSSNPTDNLFLNSSNADDTSPPVNFQPFMIYENKHACQAENPDGSLGATIPDCVSYPNPYSASIGSYASKFFTSLQYALIGGNTSSVFAGLTFYPFTPYGFWDGASKYNTDSPKKDAQGFFPEIPDGLVNGQKPQISFWDAYLNQFANQWIGSSTGTIPTQASIPASKLFITLPAGYYTLNPGSGNNLGTATVLFNTATYPKGPIPSISNYRANLIDAIGQIIATGTSPTSPISIPNAPGGNYKLEVQALDQNGSVLASTEAAAEGAGLPPVLQIALSQVALSGTPTSSSYTLSWTLSCNSIATPPAGFLAVSQLYTAGNSAPLTRLTQWIASPVCGQTYSSSFTLSKGSFPTTATQASLVLQQAGTFQNITTTTYVPITIPSS